MTRPTPSLLVLLTIVLSACGEEAEICGDGLDNDGDLLVDCFDDDCSGEAACASSPDNDGDGISLDEGDCDDDDASAHPGAVELCDGVDNDCDGDVDEEAVDASTFYADADADGYGEAASTTEACEQPSDYVQDDTDCDDTDAAIFPGADELCNGVDDDCDGQVDEDDAIDATSWYLDQDGDGYGGSTAADLTACDQPTGFVDNAEDCDDTDATVELGCQDYDLDGQSPDEGDCDDEDASVYSGAVSTHQGIEMAYICPGTFTMGSPEDEVGREDDETQHEVTLTRGFYIGVNEVTQAEFEAVMGYDHSSNADCGGCPVDVATWHEAALFSNGISALAGLADCYDCVAGECSLSSLYATPYECVGYRLPTDAEWETAGRAMVESAFHNGGNLLDGDQIDTAGNLELDNGNLLDDIAHYWIGGGTMTTQEVRLLAPNAWGLYDIHGNAWEWCDGAWTESPSKGGSDPWTAPGQDEYHSIRGGSATNFPQVLRLANREGDFPTDTSGIQGLRLARTAD